MQKNRARVTPPHSGNAWIEFYYDVMMSSLSLSCFLGVKTVRLWKKRVQPLPDHFHGESSTAQIPILVLEFLLSRDHSSGVGLWFMISHWFGQKRQYSFLVQEVLVKHFKTNVLWFCKKLPGYGIFLREISVDGDLCHKVSEINIHSCLYCPFQA